MEAIALIEQNPEILNSFSIDIIDTLYSQECIPTIYSWNNSRYLSAICPDVQETQCAAPEVISCQRIYK